MGVCYLMVFSYIVFADIQSNQGGGFTFTLLVAGIVFWIVFSSKRSDDREKRKNTQNSSKQTIKQKKVKPASDVLERIDLYIEVSKNPSTIDKEERIRRCDDLLSDFEWFSDASNSSRFEPVPEANWHALWHAVNEHDYYYEGNRYERASMSNICLEIINKNKT